MTSRLACSLTGAIDLALTARQTASEPVQLTTPEDHKRTMALLGLSEIRRGADGRNPEAPNAANYDESKANPFPELPDPLQLKNGKKVTKASVWWKQRRPEIVEEFDREVYGRMPKVTPKVNWEVTSSTNETNGDVPVVVKKLVGHVDNSSYPQVKVGSPAFLAAPARADRHPPPSKGLLPDQRGNSRYSPRVGVMLSSSQSACKPTTARD